MVDGSGERLNEILRSGLDRLEIFIWKDEKGGLELLSRQKRRLSELTYFKEQGFFNSSDFEAEKKELDLLEMGRIVSTPIEKLFFQFEDKLSKMKRGESIEIEGLPTLFHQGGGGRNFKISLRDENEHIAILALPRSDKQREDAGDLKIEFLQRFLWVYNDTLSNNPKMAAIANINRIIETLYCSPETARIARLDFCIDVLLPEAEKFRFKGGNVKSLSHNHVNMTEEITHYKEAKKPYTKAVYTGFRRGKGNSGSGMLRVYRKDIELNIKPDSIDMYEYCHTHGLQKKSLPAIWRVEWELTGSVLTEHNIRSWSEFEKNRPAILKRLSGIDESKHPQQKHTGTRITTRADRDTLHQLWAAVQVDILSIDNDEHIEKMQHEKHYMSAVQQAKAQAEKAIVRLHGIVAAGIELKIITEQEKGRYKPLVVDESVALATKRAIVYYRDNMSDVEDGPVDRMVVNWLDDGEHIVKTETVEKKED